jgi:CRP-like cAMP-binding protein
VPNTWVGRLEQFAPLSPEDKGMLCGLMSEPELFRAGEDIISEDEAPTDVHVIIKGIACRYKLLPDGRRQIMGFLFPSDACDIHICILKGMDHSIAALRPTEVAYIPHHKMLEVMDHNPRIARALWCSTLRDEAILREWLTNNGRRDAYGRIAHLLYEMFLRLQVIGETDDWVCELPLTQNELADSVALTSVHVSRTLQRLREENLIVLKRKAVTIIDPAGLCAAAQFNPNYLYLAS